MSGETIFLTGVTGFVGRHLATRLLRRPDAAVACLVRAADVPHARKRIEQSLRHAVSPAEAAALALRVEPVLGDLTLPRLGLDERNWDALSDRVDHVLHAAADVRFDRDLDDSRAYNVGGTRAVADFGRAAARRGGLRRFDWVGTAFVAGLRTDRVTEGELEHGAGWKNAYEQSKYEAEHWLRREASDLPVTVLRPSIVVGESKTGATTNFGMLYWPIRLYASGWWRTIVGRAETPVDFVPVDYVADGILALTGRDAPIGGTYHLVAGEDGARTIAQLAALVQAYFGGRGARYVEPAFFLRWVKPIVDLFLWGPKRRVLQEGGRFFIPYFTQMPRFDATRARAALVPLGIAAPTVEDYFGALLAYCRDTDFGKQVPAPAT